MTGITREEAANALAELFGTQARYIGGGYGKWTVKDREGKTWTLMSDSSITTERVTTHNSCQNVHIIKNRPGKPGLLGFMPRYTGTAKRTTHVNTTRKNAAFLGSTLHLGPMA